MDKYVTSILKILLRKILPQPGFKSGTSLSFGSERLIRFEA